MTTTRASTRDDVLPDALPTEIGVRRRRTAPWAPMSLAALVAVAMVVALAHVGLTTVVVGTLALVTGVVLMRLAYVRFSWFVLAVVGVRATVDWTHAAARTSDKNSSGGPAALLALLFGAAVILWFAARGHSGQPRRQTPLGAALLVLGAAAALSVPTAAKPFSSAAEAARIGAAILMFLAVVELVPRRLSARSVLIACCASSVVPLLVGAYQAVTGHGVLSGEGAGRVRGTLVHSNAFGFYLVLLVVVAVATIPHVDGRLRIGLGALVAVGSVELLLTYSRSSWLALVAGLVVVGCLQSRRLLVALLVSAAVAVIAVPSVSHRLTDLEAGRTDRGTAGNSLVWRFDYWRTSISLLHRNPVTGIGLKMTQFSTDAKRPPHNDFLRALVETGVVGFAAYLGFIWALCRTARRALRSAAEGAERGVAVGFAGIVAAFVLFSVGGNLLSQVVILWYLFALAAVAAALASRAEA